MLTTEILARMADSCKRWHLHFGRPPLSGCLLTHGDGWALGVAAAGARRVTAFSGSRS
jgi:hypothetical protein